MAVKCPLLSVAEQIGNPVPVPHPVESGEVHLDVREDFFGKRTDWSVHLQNGSSFNFSTLDGPEGEPSALQRALAQLVEKRTRSQPQPPPVVHLELRGGGSLWLHKDAITVDFPQFEAHLHFYCNGYARRSLRLQLQARGHAHVRYRIPQTDYTGRQTE